MRQSVRAVAVRRIQPALAIVQSVSFFELSGSAKHSFRAERSEARVSAVNRNRGLPKVFELPAFRVWLRPRLPPKRSGWDSRHPTGSHFPPVPKLQASTRSSKRSTIQKGLEVLDSHFREAAIRSRATNQNHFLCESREYSARR